MVNYAQPDLTRHPPRSPRQRLGGFVHLPRLLDKTRAFAAGRNGDYIFPCNLDQRFFAFTGISPNAFLDEVKKGKSDTEMLAWVRDHLTPTRLPHEIIAWSDWLENTPPGDAKRHGFFSEEITRLAPGRDDIATAFDRLELDDYVSFGGRG